MGQLLIFLVPLILTTLLIKQYTDLRRNIKIAKTINLPYIVVPVYTGTLLWFITAPYIIPILRYGLPSCFTRQWINLLHPYWTWYEDYKPFKALGSDTIVTVAPSGITFHTCCPEFIRQVGDRRKDFQKPLELYDILNTFGPNLVSVNGLLWRHTRKIMTPSFNDAHNAINWSETIFQTKSMLQAWSNQIQTLPANRFLDFHDHTRTLTFNIVSRGAFGVRMTYPGSKSERSSGDEGGMHSSTLQGGHSMIFSAATLTVVDGLKWLFIFPRWFLRYSPYGYFRRVWLGFHEMGTYLDEYVTNKQSKGPVDEAISLEKSGEQSNLLNSLIESNTQTSPEGGLVGLTKQQIIGNVFNSLTAGHETTGSTLFHCMINLALHPSWQRRVQADIATIFGDREPSQWDYGDDHEKLTKSSLDATVSETLRVYPPNNLVPKHSVERSGPALTLKHSDIEVNVPANSRILTLMVSTHRNPNYWPHSASSTSPSGTDMGIFKPERWFITPSEAEEIGGRSLPLHPLFADSPEARAGKGFLKPERGAFIPWSIGQRECIGKQFAHTELLVTLAVIFREWSVELVVDNASGSVAEKGDAWEVASEKAKKNMREGMMHYATMQLQRGLVPLRIVKRVR
ncbi:cytochrome P450 [Cadophora sp. DSE1049]|nr:cytochrome P450 [Cadophora sp. DSE1049]